MKMFPPWTAALAVALAAPLLLPANAQTAGSPQPIVHLAPEAMSTADRAALDARLGELAESAKIYGYNLQAGNWSYEQTLCPSMPSTVLLHYFQRFPDGTESLFTAAIPRGPGRLRIVPVLYHNAAPYVPAPRNPRNYALFNELVPSSIASADIASNKSWLELSACYAELTGTSINFSSNRTADIGIAEAPSATIHVDAKGKTAHVMFADRDGSQAYRMWSISFNHEGRVIAAGTENYSVYAAKAQPETQLQTSVQTQAQPATTAETPTPGQPVEATEQAPEQNSEPAKEQAAGTPAVPAVSTAAVPAVSTPASPAASTPATPAASTPATPAASIQPEQPVAGASRIAAAAAPPVPSATGARQQTHETGWKFIPQASQPASKLVPNAPPPPEKMMPQPPDPWKDSAPSDQQQE
ncbi:MAG: hypothetical protein WA634_10965 [Silvibacterium sp.]